MKAKAWLIVLLLLSEHLAYSQNKIGPLPQLDLYKIALINQSDSYITFPTDIGNLEPLLFEANVNPSFIVRKRKDSKLMAVLTPQIIIRMYNEESYPVRTPSYIPQITFYYLVNKKDAQNYLGIFGKIAHHSNGQDGSFYNDDGSINLQTGNYATNYLELGILKTSYSNSLKAIKTIKSSIEIHPNSWILEELKGQFSAVRWHNSFTSFKFPLNEAQSDRANFSLKAETTLMLDNYNGLPMFDLDRVNASLSFYYHPKIFEDVGIFVQFYLGMDYYNIYFKHQISVIRFGIMTEILRF